jgi:succinate-acetate transporter protein
VFLRPLANPLPLGFLALAGATLLVSGLQLEWLQPSDGMDVALILTAFVFPLQLVASVFGFLARDVVAGTGMGILAGTWLAVYTALAMALEDVLHRTVLPVGRRGGALGVGDEAGVREQL